MKAKEIMIGDLVHANRPNKNIKIAGIMRKIKCLIEMAQRLQLAAVQKGLTANLGVSEIHICFFFHDYTKGEESEIAMFSILFLEGNDKCIAEMKKVKDFVFGWKPDNKK